LGKSVILLSLQFRTVIFLRTDSMRSLSTPGISVISVSSEIINTKYS
jgi:transcriptional antiterminator Rof (Rho-off)